MPASTLGYSAFQFSFKRAAMTLSLLVLIQHGVVEHAHAADAGAPGSSDATDQGEALWNRFAENNRRSNNLRLRILFSEGQLVERPGGSRFEELIPFDDLLEQARGSTDPVVLSLLFDRCPPPRLNASSPCDRVELARRWVTTDTQNQISWIAFATALKDAGDLQGARAAWTSAAQASTFRDNFREIERTIVNALPRDLPPIQRYRALTMSIGKSVAIPWSTVSRMLRGCKDQSLRSECLRIGQTALRDADSFALLTAATRLVDRLDPTDAGPRSRAQTRHALSWASMNRSNDESAIDADDDAAIERINRELSFMIEHGEIAFARESLRRLGVSEAEAANHYLDAFPQASVHEAKLLEDARRSAGTTK